MDAPNDKVAEEGKKGIIATASAAATRVIMGVVKKSPLVVLAEELGVDEDKIEDFQRRIKEITQTTSRIMRSEATPVWGEVSYDKSPIHFDKEAALASKLGKFIDTPIHGTREAAHGDFYASRVLDEVNLVSKEPLVYVSKIIKFKEPLYPGESLSWKINRVSRSEKGLDLSVVGETSDGKTAVEFPTLRLASKRGELSWEDLYAHNFGAFRFNLKNITHSNLEAYCSCLDIGSGKMAMAHAELLGPALLLELVFEKTGEYLGVYRSVEFTYYNEPTLGEFKISVGNLAKPKEKHGEFIYNFGLLCGQEDRPILYAKIRCGSDKKLA